MEDWKLCQDHETFRTGLRRSRIRGANSSGEDRLTGLRVGQRYRGTFLLELLCFSLFPATYHQCNNRVRDGCFGPESSLASLKQQDWPPSPLSPIIA